MKKLNIDWNRTGRVMLAGCLLVSTITGCSAAPSSQYKTAETTAAGAMAAGTTSAETMGAAVLADQQMPDSQENYKQVYQQEETDNSNEEYRAIEENGFESTARHPLSTFSADVDTAAYSNIRRMIEQGNEIPEDAVRVEEMINYFHYDYASPAGEEPLAVTTELSGCPWNPDNRLLLIGLKAKDIDFENRPMSNLVFLLDVSGSMYDEDKLPLVQKSFSMLTEELTENDRVSIVTYAGYESVVIEGVNGEEKTVINDALMSLTAGGSTAGGAGIQKAYDLARQYYIPGGNNRVILATDGDLNVGITSESALKRLITEERKSGVHLSVLGFGTGNIKDNKMMALADNGDGNYRYIDNALEAKKVLVEEMGGTLITVAKDVKLQVEFNPETVKGYRLVGYEKRKLADEDFANDKVDAGEIGSGHNVTALYELIPADDGPQDADLMTVNIRYKAPNGNESKLESYPVNAGIYREEPSSNLKFASAVAEFGMVLRNSEWKGNSSFSSVMGLASDDVITDDYRAGFVTLVQKAARKYND